VEKFYVDTSIWIDLYEDRKGYNNEPLGEFALRLFAMIKAKKKRLIISDILIKELEKYYSIEQINGMIKPFEEIIENIFSTKEQIKEARRISEQRSLPPGDALHAILAGENKFILISRDKDFRMLADISKCYKPEEVI